MSDHVQYGRVERVERIAPRMVRIVLTGEGLDNYVDTPYTDQYVNALFVPAGCAVRRTFRPGRGPSVAARASAARPAVHDPLMGSRARES